MGFKNRFHFPAVANFYHHATIEKKITCFYRGGQGAPGIAPEVQDQCGGFRVVFHNRAKITRGLVQELIDPNHQDTIFKLPLPLAVRSSKPEHGLGSDLPTNDGERLLLLIPEHRDVNR